jgi:hypothetical protein
MHILNMSTDQQADTSYNHRLVGICSAAPKRLHLSREQDSKYLVRNTRTESKVMFGNTDKQLSINDEMIPWKETCPI